MEHPSKRKITEVTELLTGIPDELFIVEIVAKKLDVKTLRACACVSKWWNKTLNSQEFIDTRRRHHCQSIEQLFFVDCNWQNNIVVHDQHGSVINLFEFGNWDSPYQISPVCHGLVCVKYMNNDFVYGRPLRSIRVCNPWTGQSVKLPSIPRVYDFHDPGVFGYLDSLGKYVVVKVCKTLVNKLSFNRVNNHSSSSEWKWETIKDACPRRVRDGIFVGNFVYWLIDDANATKNNELIVSLNLENEEFGIINCPQTPQWKSFPHFDYFITLIDLNGTLCLTDQKTLLWSTPVFLLCALKRELGQWEMKYNVKLDNLGMQLDGLPLRYCPKSSMEGELILESQECGTWYIYNPKTNGIRTITRPPPNYYGSCKSASFFIETWPPTKLC